MLSVFMIEQSAEWDKIVENFKERDVYWLSGYVKAFKLHGDGEPLLFYYEDGDGRAINVVMKRDISKTPYFSKSLPENTCFDLSTPYGYGGWLIEGDCSKKLFKAYEEWCVANNIVSEFVRFHPVINNVDFAKEAYDVVCLGNTIALDLSSPDVIWENIISKNRNMIRKAEKNGVQIHQGSSIELYQEFMKIYNKTMEHDEADKYYFFEDDFYTSIREDLSRNSQIFYATAEDGTIISMAIMLSENGKMNYHLSGSVFEYRAFAPTNLLLYKAALWGCENGCKTFHLGGGVGGSEDKLFAFKKSFYRKDDLCDFYIGKKIFNKKVYDELVKLRGNTDRQFFPKYRA